MEHVDLARRMDALIDFLNDGNPAGEEHAATIAMLAPAEREPWLRDHPEALTWHTLTALLVWARAALDSRPPLALELTEIAVAHAGEVPVAPDSASMRAVLLAQAWRERGNALRLHGDRRAALLAFIESSASLEAHPEATTERAAARREAALILADLGHPDEALRIIREGREVFLGRGADHDAVVSRLYEGTILFDERRYREAFLTWKSALDEAEELGDHETVSRLYNDLGQCARMLQDLTASAEHLGRAAELFDKYDMSTESARARDGQSELLADDGDVTRALASMEDVRAAFLAKDLPVDAAQTELDMLELQWLAGRGAEVYRRAAELVDLFVRSGILRDAIRANALLQTEEARRALSPELTHLVTTALAAMAADRQPVAIP